jgi:hypothetical protein
MIEIVFTKRNCKLNVGFFQYIIRKIPASKQIILLACEQIINNKKKIRKAQLKQLEKLKNIILKHQQTLIKKEN